jgi:hypothetical protein
MMGILKKRTVEEVSQDKPKGVSKSIFYTVAAV